MKKFTLLVLSLLFVFAVEAQLFNIAGFGVGYLYVGPKAGGNLSYVSVDAGTGMEKAANYGYQFGGVAKFGITKKLAIQPELVMTSKGYKLNSTSTDFTQKENFKYFGLPVAVKYAFASIAGIQVYGSGGFYTDVLTGVTYKAESETNGFGETIEYTSLDPFSRVDFGFSIGGGANIPFKNKDQLNLELQFSQGFVNVEKTGTSSSSKNTAVQLSATYLVDLTKWINFKGKSILDEDAYKKDVAPAGGSKVEREE